MRLIMPESTTGITTRTGVGAYPSFPAPAWATSHHDFGNVIAWSHQVVLDAVEVDGPEGLIVEVCVFDNIEANVESGVVIRRGTPEIQITRRGDHGKADPNEVPLRFEIANARRVIAALQKCIDAIDGTPAATA